MIKIFLASIWILISFNVSAQSCSYNTWRWNVRSAQTVQFERIVHPYDSLLAEERDADSGCTVCEEDQVKIEIAGLPSFQLCKLIAPQVKNALMEMMKQGAPIQSVIAYRVGRTRGKIDQNGNRSDFSNHSFGVALDINTAHNGLYTQCIVFGPHCLLSRGGAWKPGTDPYSLAPSGPAVRLLKASGFKWGGEIAGLQKDFMHFSPSGY